MFGQMKDLYNIQKQAREMKKQLEAEAVTGTSKDGSIKMTINGSYELLSVKISPDAQLSPAGLEQGVTQAFNDASAQIKSILMEKFKGMM